MTTPLTQSADAVARLTKLADDYASRGDFATEDDIRTLLAAYADAARDRERMDWLESNGEYTIANPASEGDDWWLFFNDDARDVINAPTLRAAIDAARTGEAR